jgi:hypothetical protein
VTRGSPLAIRAEPPPPPTACVEEQEPNNVSEQATPRGDATCAVGEIDAFNGDGVDVYVGQLAIGTWLVRRIQGQVQLSAQVGDDVIPGTQEVRFVVTDPLVLVYLWVAIGNGPYEFEIVKEP